jgi:uncharacterized protein YndB with AHSA1/START domain
MARLDLRIFIRAAPERVWEVLSDLQGQKQWMVDLRRLDITSEQQTGVGAEMDVTSELFGLPLVKDRMIITAWEPPTPESRIGRFDVKHVGSFSGTGAFILEPALDGTVFTWIEEFQPPLGRVGEVGFSMSVGPHLSRVFRRSMENVRRLAEASPTKPG